MCGRFSITVENIYTLAERFHAEVPPFGTQPHFNVAPSQEILVVVNWENRRKLIPMHWGLIPHWSKNSSKSFPLINIRSERLVEKATFNRYFEKQRCLIPADGFYEWKKEGKNKVPYRAIVKHMSIFALAGFWDATIEADGIPSFSFTILTTEANSLLAPIHDRMPAILSPEAEEHWLNPSLHPKADLFPLLTPFPASKMHLYQVSTKVNSSRYNAKDCIDPVH